MCNKEFDFAQRESSLCYHLLGGNLLYLMKVSLFRAGIGHNGFRVGLATPDSLKHAGKTNHVF